jgi:uncharacterized membrane protein YvbJ
MGFYCENCGNEVKRNSDTCPECGVSFKAVKCPACGFTDKADFFKGGCPSCGYLAKEEKFPYDNDQKKKTGKPFLGFIPASVFWFSGIGLLGILMIILFIFLK